MEPGSLSLGLSHKPFPSPSAVGSPGSGGETGLLNGRTGSRAHVGVPHRTDGAADPASEGINFTPSLGLSGTTKTVSERRQRTGRSHPTATIHQSGEGWLSLVWRAKAPRGKLRLGEEGGRVEEGCWASAEDAEPSHTCTLAGRRSPQDRGQRRRVPKTAADTAQLKPQTEAVTEQTVWRRRAPP